MEGENSGLSLPARGFLFTVCLSIFLNIYIYIYIYKFPKNSEVFYHDYSLRNFNDFLIPRVRNDFLEKFPFFSFTSSWNNLDNRFKTLSRKNEFKLKIKQYLLAKYSGFQCQRLFCYICSRTNS